MDEFEVIYTEEDIKAVQDQLSSLTKSYNQITKEKKDIEIFVDTLREKIHSLESTKSLYEEAQKQLQAQKQSIQDLQKKQEAILAQKNEQDNKLIKVMKEKYNIQQELEKIKSSNEELSMTMIEEMEEMKKKMNQTFQEQSKIQQEATRQQIVQLQQLSQQRLIEKQIEFEEICNQLEKTNQELSLQKEICKELEAKLEYSAEKIKELSNKLSEEKANVELFKKQIEEYKQRYQANQQSQNQLKEELINAQTKIKQLSVQISQLTEQHQNISGDSSKYKNQIAKLEEEHKNLLEIQQVLSSENSELSSQSLKFKKQIEQFQNEKEELKIAIVAKNQAIEAKDQAIEKLNLEKSQDLVKLEANYRKQIDSQTQSNHQLTARLNEVQMTYANTLDKLENSENTCRDLLQQIQNLQNELQSQIMTSRENAEQLSQDLQDTKAKLDAVSQKYQQALQEIAQKEQQTNSIVQDLSKQVADLKSFITSKNQENEHLKIQNQSLAVGQEEMRKICEEEMRKICEEQIRDKEQKYKKEIESICQQKENYIKIIEKTSDEMLQLKQQLKLFNQMIQDQQNIMESEKKQHHTQLEEEISKNKFSNSQIEDLQELVEQLKMEIQENESVLSYTQQQLRSTEEELYSAKRKIDQLHLIIKEKEQIHQEIQNQLQKQDQEKQQYLAQINQLSSRSQNLEENTLYLENENESLRNQNKELKINAEKSSQSNQILSEENDYLRIQNESLKEQNSLMNEEIQQILQELDAKGKCSFEQLNNANHQLSTIFSTFSQLFGNLSQVVNQQAGEQQHLIIAPQFNQSSSFDVNLNFMRESMTQLINSFQNISNEKLQSNLVSLQLKEQLAQQLANHQIQVEQNQNEKHILQQKIQELELSSQQLNQEIANLKQQASQCLSPSNKIQKDSYYDMNYEQLENDYKISQSILLDQKQQLKDLKYDLEQKIKKYQEENQALTQKNWELQERAEILEMQVMNLSQKMGEQEFSQNETLNNLNDYMNQIQQQQQEIQNLQQLLEEQDFENVLVKKIQQNNELATNNEERNNFNEQTIESARNSISKIVQHYNLKK